MAKYKVGDEVIVRLKVFRVHDYDDKYTLCDLDGNGAVFASPDMIIPHPSPSPIICDPTSPEAWALIGRRVWCSDQYAKIKKFNCGSGILDYISADEAYPFPVGTSSWKFIREYIEEPRPVKKMTVSEVCKELGYDVEIVKEVQ